MMSLQAISSRGPNLLFPAEDAAKLFRDIPVRLEERKSGILTDEQLL